MEASDPIFEKIITSHPLLKSEDARMAESWWLIERRTKEGLLDFLVRQKVLAPDCLRTIELFRRGVLTYVDTKRIFGEKGHQVLRDYSRLIGIKPAATLSGKSGGLFSSSSGNLNSSGRLQPPVSGRLNSTTSSGFSQPVQPVAPPTPRTDSALADQMDELKSWMNRRVEAPPASNSILESKSGTHSHRSKSILPESVRSETVNLQSSNSKPKPKEPGKSGVISGKPKFPLVGDQIGKYLLTEEIGRGGTAVVFRGLNRSLNSSVAIKVLRIQRIDLLTDDQTEQYDSLKREAQLLARFNHTNLVRVFDLETDGDFPFIVLEFVDGLPLDVMLNHTGRMRPDKAARMIEQIASGLYSAQEKIGLVHRDIKPGNILLSKDGNVKLADLGLALISEDFMGQGSISTKELVGTAAYMAPEQANMEEVDHRADIYSLGASFYHSLVGEMPFRGKTRMELIFKHSTEPITPPHSIVPGLDSRYSEVITKMMMKNPAERYQTYEELLGDLNTLQSVTSTNTDAHTSTVFCKDPPTKTESRAGRI